ncbi:Uncharacterized conserved protein YbbK, DUF523 family [Thermanaeromonas toyohensis ToBE]|uniref:Uncharacterized conserved protein YbbK, DUF523 family n=1 Tax=Thermanaeromonas toyohensis ToBE TaxID=698762 RepID=A0A1W1VI16_9FIRM|nr:DUF523 domain-containing protein [Thermanaeromonas toyohensis]SMB93019.1 Uncharacterized conserved protein YbbK, DUF523 family [Thermanaeromonas toyohensis ToBE]
MENRPPILVSACLAGYHCKYNGGSNLVPEIKELVTRRQAIPVCPEKLGGLSIPRPPAEIQGGDGFDVLEGRARVVDKEGRDVTAAFLQGARATAELARALGTRVAILKERSPSCGIRAIYNGTFSGCTRTGCGVTAALLLRQGLQLFSEETWKE